MARVSLDLSCFSFARLLDPAGLHVCTDLGSLQPLFQPLSQSCLFLLSLWGSDDTNGRSFEMVPLIWGYVNFSSLLSGFFFSWLGNLYCFIFQVIDSFIYPLHSAVEPIHWISGLVFVFSVLKFPFASSLYFSFLCCTISLLERC